MRSPGQVDNRWVDNWRGRVGDELAARRGSLFLCPNGHETVYPVLDLVRLTSPIGELTASPDHWQWASYLFPNGVA